jgi:hypothetical protein
MIFRMAFWLVLAAILAVAGYVVVKVYQNRIKIEEIAVWDGRANELRLAATMPSCGCLTLKPTGSQMPEMILAARLNDSPTWFSQVPVRKPFPDSLVFAFDWAGSDLGDRYQIQAFELPKPTSGSSDAPSTKTSPGADSTAASSIPAGALPLDMSAHFEMEALPQRSCDEVQCRFGDLGLNKALAENVGQNAVASSFTGVRVGRNNRVIEAQATGRHRGAPGDCGCMLLDVFGLPADGKLTLTSSISGTIAGDLTFRKAGALVRIPFDYGGTRGDDTYVISVEGGERQITDYVRVLGHLDGMECSGSAAEFLGIRGGTGGAVAATGQAVTSDSVTSSTRLPAGAPTAAPTVITPPGAQQTPVPPERFDVLRLRCPYKIEGVDGTMNLVRTATKLTDDWLGEWVFQKGDYGEAGKLRRVRSIAIKSDDEDNVSIDITFEDGTKMALTGRLDGEDQPLDPGLAAAIGANTVAFGRASDRGWRIVLKNNAVVSQESTATVAPDGGTMRLETFGRAGAIQGARKIETFGRSEKSRASPPPR